MSRRFDKLLVLDVDETLIYASMCSLPQDPDFQVGLAHAWKRPGVDDFMARCLEWFEVGIWTSATRPYVLDVLPHLACDPANLAFVFAREQCTRAIVEVLTPTSRPCPSKVAVPDPAYPVSMFSCDVIWMKDLQLLVDRGYAAERILVVDDSPEVWTSYAEHVIPVAKFKGDPQDRELDRLLPFLEELGALVDIRAVPKDRRSG